MKTYVNVALKKGGEDKEVNLSVSLTVPDMDMSIKEIFRRFANGTIDPISNQSLYSDDLPDIRGLDWDELSDLSVDLHSEISMLKNSLASVEERKSEILDSVEGDFNKARGVVDNKNVD